MLLLTRFIKVLPSLKTRQQAFLFWCAPMLCLCLCAPCTDAGAAAADIQEIVAEGRAYLGEDTTPAQARAMAMNDARRIAVERASGILVSSTSVVYNSQLISDLISAFAKGLIVREEILTEGLRTENGRAVYVCRIRAHVKPVPQETGKGIRIVRAEVSRADRPFAATAPVFQDSDEILIRLKAQGDLFMNLFSVDQDGRIVCLLPNPYSKHERISSGQDFIFPDETLRAMGFRLRVHAPKHLSRAYETIVAIATREKRDFLSGRENESTLSDLMRELSQLDQSSWADAVIGYEVRK